jgi:hypothetical protein
MYSTKKGLVFNPEKSFALIADSLLPSENILGFFHATANVLVSDDRIAGFKIGMKAALFSIPLHQIISISPNSSEGTKLEVLTLDNGEEYKLPMIGKNDKSIFLEILNDAINRRQSRQDQKLLTPSSKSEEYSQIDSNVSWDKIPKHLQKNIEVNISENEWPHFIIANPSSTMAGAIVGLSDRCLIIKSGALGGLMAGSLGGARVASFYYSEITGVEFNSGMVTGVVEILTSSYEGSKNKDYWRGTNKSRNSDSNDPWVLSNCLPMPKINYANAKKQFDQLRELISKNKSGGGIIQQVVSQSSAADEIAKLSDLLAKGLIDEDEFRTLKSKIISG